MIYIIKKSYGKWSSSTEVEASKDIKKGDKTVTVYHAATKEAFEIPPSYLVPKRKRS